MDEEEIEEQFIQDQIYLWETQYEAEQQFRSELEADRIVRKPAIITVHIEREPVIQNNQYDNTNPGNGRTNHPTKRKFHPRKQGKKH